MPFANNTAIGVIAGSLRCRPARLGMAIGPENQTVVPSFAHTRPVKWKPSLFLALAFGMRPGKRFVNAELKPSITIVETGRSQWFKPIPFVS